MTKRTADMVTFTEEIRNRKLLQCKYLEVLTEISSSLAVFAVENTRKGIRGITLAGTFEHFPKQ